MADIVRKIKVQAVGLKDIKREVTNEMKDLDSASKGVGIFRKLYLGMNLVIHQHLQFTAYEIILFNDLK